MPELRSVAVVLKRLVVTPPLTKVPTPCSSTVTTPFV